MDENWGYPHGLDTFILAFRENIGRVPKKKLGDLWIILHHFLGAQIQNSLDCVGPTLGFCNSVAVQDPDLVQLPRGTGCCDVQQQGLGAAKGRPVFFGVLC